MPRSLGRFCLGFFSLLPFSLAIAQNQTDSVSLDTNALIDSAQVSSELVQAPVVPVRTVAPGSRQLRTGWEMCEESDTNDNGWRPILLPAVFRTGQEIILRRIVNVEAANANLLVQLPPNTSLRVNGRLVSPGLQKTSALLRQGKNEVLLAFPPVTAEGLVSPETPRRYVGLNEVPELVFGAAKLNEQRRVQRRISVKEDRILVDGREVVFKGVTYVPYDQLELSALSYSRLVKDLIRAKRLGANLIRLLGDPTERFLQLTDSLDLYVFIEAEHPEWAVQQFKSHPSIIAWGLGRDRDDTDPVVREEYTRLSRWIKSQGAWLTYFVSRFPLSTFALDIGVLSTSYLNAGHADNRARQSFREMHVAKKPFFLIDIGPGVFSERHAGSDNWGSHEYHARKLYDQAAGALSTGYTGVIAGLLTDYKTEVPSAFAEAGLTRIALFGPDGSLRPGEEAIRHAFNGERYQPKPGGSPDDDRPISFMVISLVVMFLCFLIMNIDRRFREHAYRALARPFNFFADIRDQRLIPNAQTTLLAWFISVGVGLVVGSLLYMFRDDYFASLALLSMIPSEHILGWLAPILHRPVVLSLVITVFYWLGIIVLAAVIRTAAMFVKQRIFYGDTLNVVTWSFLPLLVLLPVGMLLARMDRDGSTALAIFWVLLLLHVWLLFRLLKGVAVLFDVYPTRVYLYYGSAIVALVVAAMLHMDYHYSLFANLQYISHLANAMQ